MSFLNCLLKVNVKETPLPLYWESPESLESPQEVLLKKEKKETKLMSFLNHFLSKC